MSFNLRREANPLATTPRGKAELAHDAFQSQARSQSPGDFHSKYVSLRSSWVSISGEKPIPWRLAVQMPLKKPTTGFNLRREANPLATQVRHF